jgi:putative Mg2+ transporter-C (MgtC) family protein
METTAVNIPWLLLLERLATAILCGAAIGLEREWKRKGAGLRTMMLISLGSALYITVSELMSLHARQPFDVTRVAAQVASGVGFIGAGTIIVARGQVHGLTTAATIWTVAAIGLIIGAGFPQVGLAVTAAVLVILLIIGMVERRFVRPLIGEGGKGEEKEDIREA